MRIIVSEFSHCTVWEKIIQKAVSKILLKAAVRNAHGGFPLNTRVTPYPQAHSHHYDSCPHKIRTLLSLNSHLNNLHCSVDELLRVYNARGLGVLHRMRGQSRTHSVFSWSELFPFETGSLSPALCWEHRVLLQDGPLAVEALPFDFAWTNYFLLPGKSMSSGPSHILGFFFLSGVYCLSYVL